jgi:hypothetical protein
MVVDVVAASSTIVVDVTAASSEAATVVDVSSADPLAVVVGVTAWRPGSNDINATS